MFNSLRKAIPPTPDLNRAKSAIDSLPQIMEAVAKIPATLRELPAAPVILGAASRMVASAIAGELERRGPSARFLAVCEAAEVREAQALELHAALLDELRVR